MNRHLQPITARANTGIKKDCGCVSPVKMKSKEDKASNKELKFMENIEKNAELPSKMCNKKH